MDPESMHRVIGGGGHSGPAMLEDPGIMGMQGIAVVEDTFHITTSNGPFLPGSVYVGQVAPGEPARFRRFRWATPIGCEDLSYWPSSTDGRSEEHTSELQSLMRISYAVFCLKKKTKKTQKTTN